MINKNKKFSLLSIIQIFISFLLYLTIQNYEMNAQRKIIYF
jgi:hypothetical protein